MRSSAKSLMALTLALSCFQFSSPAFALTQEECQAHRDSIDTSIAVYKANVAITIANAFRTNSRYARATQITLNKTVARFVLLKNAEFAALCPDYVPPQP